MFPVVDLSIQTNVVVDFIDINVTFTSLYVRFDFSLILSIYNRQ